MAKSPIWLKGIALAMATAVGACGGGLVTATSLHAQGYYDDGYDSAPRSVESYRSDGYDTEVERSERPMTARERRCLDLERELVRETQLHTRGRNLLPELYKEQREADRAFRQAERQAERRNCYEQFLFTRQLRRTRRCHRLDREIRRAKSHLSDIQRRIEQIRSARSDSYRREQLIGALAQNGCGRIYQRAARRRSSQSRNLFDSIFGGRGGFSNRGYYDNAPADVEPETGIIAGATYRTMCVRLCDGYYFPISFSTVPSRFGKDRQVCQSKCSAPAELYVYQNPGGQVEQMISPDGAPYSEIENAFRYRKEYIKGCSCKLGEYDPEAIAAAEAGEQGEPSPAEGDAAQGEQDTSAMSGEGRSVARAPADEGGARTQ